MTTLTLQVDDPSILAKLKEMLKPLHGVKIIRANNKEYVEDKEVPNHTTLEAINELEQGKDAGRVSLDSLESFIASMQ